jgi:hypothetical protein
MCDAGGRPSSDAAVAHLTSLGQQLQIASRCRAPAGRQSYGSSSAVTLIDAGLFQVFLNCLFVYSCQFRLVGMQGGSLLRGWLGQV